MKIIVYQLGARRHFAVARGMFENQVLEALHVDAAATTFPWRYLALVPILRSTPMIRSVMGRKATGIDSGRITGHFAFVLRNLLLQSVSGKNVPASDRWVKQNRLFCGGISSRTWNNADTVYAYNGAALEIFERAKNAGKRCVLDQTAAPWRWNTELLKRERDIWPDWEPMPSDLDVRGTMIAREEREWELADRIICGSQFVVDRISEVNGPREKCRVVLYPVTNRNRPIESRIERDEACTVLFVGTLQLRKGVQYLYEAVQRLPRERFRFRMVGPNLLTEQATRNMRSLGMEVTGSVPRDAVEDEYARADIFVLPTLSEGSANVCHEAIAAGLPVITTHAAGLVSHPQVSIVPEMDSLALADAIQAAALRESSPVPQSHFARSIREYGLDLIDAITE
jgi:glycosyltransferase involved in cell wall biosynthesis